MKSGRAVAGFPARDGRKVVLRTPRGESLNGFPGLMSSLVNEKAETSRTKRSLREEETDFLTRALSRLERMRRST